METYRIENLTFSYPNRESTALKGINLSIPQGSFTTLCGASGCGKTTLLRQLKPSTAPHGVKYGAIFFENTQIEKLSEKDAAAKIGFIMQSAENQIVTDKVWHELAFGLESLGVKTPEIRLRVAEISNFFGIQTWFHKSVTELSGGQKQILALASVMAMQPSVLILDEPTSQLDPIAAGEFLAMLGKINRELGVTIVLTEHRLEETLPLSSNVIVMDNGKLTAENTPQKIGLSLYKQNHKMFTAMPTPMRVWAACEKNPGEDEKCPITVSEGAAWIAKKSVQPIESTEKPADCPKPAINLKDIWFRYEKNLPDVVKGLNFTANYGEIMAVLGGNGTGKTTMLSLIARLYKPYRGKIHTNEKVFALPQNPQSIFVAKTVREDLLEIAEESKNLSEIIKLCRLEDLLNYHPYDLSGGEQQRAALAKVLMLQPKILLLDEPTKGLDAEYKQIFATILKKLTAAGAAVVIVSHDIEFCAEYSDKCALFFDGDMVTENTPREFFSGNSFYTTSANRMSRRIIPNAITTNDLIQALGGESPPKPKTSDTYSPPLAPTTPKFSISQQSKLPKRTITAAAMIFLAIPATIYIGINFFNDRQFYFISMLIVLQTMLPFVLVFEGRKPRARELVIIAVLCAIGVAGRAAFFMLPQFKPVTAVVIIAGVAFGGEVGFLVGAMTAFVSNMFFGQGPWTPWQMFAFGIIGF
ncbi:MAG: ATP-binding cassette domain-containing protein, partial [Defluviitaleaceae bacterium]|nr:ATP-binding cassette domain-containing protein [Defluviitaleaceae bacterium]